MISPQKLTTAADSVLRNTMEIRNHLTPEHDDQYSKVTVYVSKAGQLKFNTGSLVFARVSIQWEAPPEQFKA